jgi:amino acid permease
MSYLKPILKSKSNAAKLLFIASILFAGPVSFYLYDFYIQWSESSNQSIAWYLAFAYEYLGAWGGVLIGFVGSAICLTIGYALHRRKRMYYWR